MLVLLICLLFFYQCIKLLEQSLLVYTRISYPADWERTTASLASAYRMRVHGSKPKNIDKGIKLFAKSLLVCTTKSQPEEWARTTYNLALAYRHRIGRSRSENLTMSIKLLKTCQCVWTQKSHPLDWADVQLLIATNQIQLEPHQISSKSAWYLDTLKYLQLAYAIFQHHQDHARCARCCAEIGRCNVMCNQLKYAKRSFMQSIQHIEKLRCRIRAGRETKDLSCWS